jgi:hypothetical protein
MHGRRDQEGGVQHVLLLRRPVGVYPHDVPGKKRRGEARKDNAPYIGKHGRMARDGHELLKVSPGLVMPDPFGDPFRDPTPYAYAYSELCCF